MELLYCLSDVVDMKDMWLWGTLIIVSETVAEFSIIVNFFLKKNIEGPLLPDFKNIL